MSSIFTQELTLKELITLSDCESFLLDHGMPAAEVEQELHSELALLRRNQARMDAARAAAFAACGDEIPF